MPKYKLIALDLDGSLLQNDLKISAANRHWIKQAEEAGIVVSFATGRGRSSSEQYWDVVRPQAPMVVVNGAEVWRNHQELLSRHLLPAHAIPRLHKLALEYKTWYWAHAPGKLVRKEAWATDYDPQGDWLKFGMATEDSAVIDHLRDLVESWGEFEVTSSAPTNLEISKKGISKASGLSEIAKILEIDPSEVVVVGDSLNDLEMIKWAGFGVAMGNAEASIKAVADHITGTNEEDGVAQLIQLILE
jgi:hypothetical protein